MFSLRPSLSVFYGPRQNVIFSAPFRRSKGFLSNIMDKVRKEAEKDEELSSSLKQFESLTDVKQNKTIQSVKRALSNAKREVVEQNEAVFQELHKKTESIQRGVEHISDTISTVTEPVRKLGRRLRPHRPGGSLARTIGQSRVSQHVQEQLKKVQDTIVDDTESFRYGGFVSKDKRQEILEERRKTSKEASTLSTPENPNAGESLVIHKNSAWRQKWLDFKDNNPVLKSLFEVKRSYDESNNVFVYLARSITNVVGDTWRSMFRENETAQVIKEIRQIDPSFQLDEFMKLCREIIIPEILDAFLNSDIVALRSWCSEAAFQVLKTHISNMKELGQKSEGKVLDLRSVDLVAAKLLDDRPVLIISFQVQQVYCLKDAATNQVSPGHSEDKIETIFHVWALAKEQEHDPVSGGWRLIEASMRPANEAW